MSNKDWYPTISIRLGDLSWNAKEMHSKGKIIAADLDTGGTGLWVGEELLQEIGIKRSHLNFSEQATHLGETFSFYTKKLKVSLVGELSETDSEEFPCSVIEDFQTSPFIRINPNRLALAGRTLIQKFNAVVEFDGQRNTTRIILQDWQGFERQVADLYRALGLRVQRNVNLSGNQIDVFLEEYTTSGKALRTIVECKFYQKPVGIQQVRELAGLFDFVRSSGLADHAVLISSSGFTKDAYLVATTSNIELLEINDLRARVLSKETSAQKLKVIESQPETNMEPPKTQKTAFVIMPFGDEFRDVYILGIRESVAQEGFVCIRADEMQFNGRIMEKIFDSIRDADFIIAEVTEHNPNVFYELGLAHAMAKNVILCTKDVSRSPFDVRDLNHIVYRDIVDLRQKLSERIESLILINRQPSEP